MMRIEKVLHKIYYTPSNPASFGSVKKLYKEAKKKFPTITLDKVRAWLKGEFTYTLHHPIRKNFQRNRILVNRIDDQWESDLVDMREFKGENDGYEYLITTIDVLSKFAWVIPIKNKTAIEVKNGYEKILKDRQPAALRTDKGGEFNNKMLKKFLESKNIHYFTSQNEDVKCAVIERFNRTLKEKMFRYFTSCGTHRYIDKLKEFVNSYNNTEHRSIKMIPAGVNYDNQHIAFENLYKVKTYREAILKRKKRSNLNVGDTVRMKYNKGPLEKGYYPQWTDEIFVVTKSIKGDKAPLIHVKDSNGEPIEGRFYPDEVLKVTENEYRVQEVLAERIRSGKKEYYVKWLNYPSSFNSWVTEENMRDFQ